jgi:cytochrome bd ubiquinol oxidase subunit I
VSAWHLHRDGAAADPAHRKAAGMALAFMLVSFVGVTLVGHLQGQLMTKQQPMKMAAAEALWHTQKNAPFSLFAYGDVSKGDNKFDIKIPDGLSQMATDHPSGTVQGIADIQAAEQAKFGPGNYVPIVGLAYWCFRLMIGFGILAGLLAIFWAVKWRRGGLWASRRLLAVSSWAVVLPLLANTAGWLFTETARQPWLVYGLLKTHAGVSTNVSTAMVAVTLVIFTGLYGLLAVVCGRMFIRIARQGPGTVGDGDGSHDTDEGLLSLAY